MTDPNPAPAPAPSPEPKQSPQNNNNNNSNTEADLRAEAAARRIEAKNEREGREKAEQERDEAVNNGKKAVEQEAEKFKPVKEKLEGRILQSELKAAAVEAGLKDLDLLPLIKRDAIKLDDEGNPTGIEDAIKAFKEAKPEYFKADGGNKEEKTPPVPPKKSGSDKAPPADPDPKRQNVKALSKAEYEAEKRAAIAKIRKAS